MHAVMDPEERDLGSIIIDLGGGTTDAIVINKDAPVCTVSIPVGGNLVTNDIAVVKGVSAANAEKIKIEDGCCWRWGWDVRRFAAGIGCRWRFCRWALPSARWCTT